MYGQRDRSIMACLSSFFWCVRVGKWK